MLTTKKIEKLRRVPGRYHVGHSLYLQVVPNGASWLLRYQINGRERWMGLGSARLFSLSEAKESAKEAQRQLKKDRIDPVEARRAAKAAAAVAAAKAITFRQAAAAYIASHEAGWTVKHREQVDASLATFVFPVFGHLPVKDIDTGIVVAALKPHWQTKVVTMSRVRSRVEAVLGWCIAGGYRGEPNPARWKHHLDQLLARPSKVAKVEHHTALPYRDIPSFMAALRQREGTAALALQFLVMTAARTSEVTGARWSEIDLKTATWTIPATRMKADREHRVPLSNHVIALLQSLHVEDDNDHLFIGPRAGLGLSGEAMAVLLKRMRINATVHGFRSAFSDWAHETSTFPNHVIEISLAHAVGSEVERAYRRGDLLQKRRKLMQAWATFCCAPPVEETGGNVLPFHA